MAPPQEARSRDDETTLPATSDVAKAPKPASAVDGTEKNPAPTVSLSGRSLDTDGDSDDEDFDPVKSGSGDDDDASSAGSDEDGSSSEDDDASDDDDDDDALAAKASFLRSFGDHAEGTDGTADDDAAPAIDDDAGALPLADAEMEDLFDTDESDTDSDDDDDDDDDVSLVPEDSNVLNGVDSCLIPGSEYSPSASVSAATKRTGNKAQSPSIGTIPRELFLYSPSLKRRAREEQTEAEAAKKAKRGVTQSPTTRFGAKRSLFYANPGLQQISERFGGSDGFDEPPVGVPRAPAMKPYVGSLDDSGDESENVGVARRTRAHISLADIDLDYIETLMPLPDECGMGFQFHDDDEEYANFLSALDFDIATGVGGGDAVGGEGTRRPNPTSADSDDDESDDDDYANVDPKAARVERRQRRYQTVPVRGAATDLPSPQTRNTRRAADTKNKYKSKLDRPEYQERPVWSTVVTRNARLRAEAAAAATISSLAVAGTATVVAVGVLPAAHRPPTLAQFTPAQTGTLHKMISDHTQLLLQTFARGAWDFDQASNAAARAACGLLTQMLQEVKSRLVAKDKAKDNPHAPNCFQKPQGWDPQKWWPPPRPDGNAQVYTVLDCVPLRMASKFVNDVHCVGLVIRVPPGIHVPLHAIPPVMLPTPIPASAFAAARPLGGSLTKMQAWDARMAEIDARRDALEKQYGRLSELFRLENTGPDENTYLDEWKNAYLDDETPHEGGLGSEKTKQRSRRKPPPDEMIPFFSRLPIGVVNASRSFAGWVNPEVLPRVPNLRITHDKDRWLPSEDYLLALGIENYGITWEAIRRNLLPSKTTRQIINRQKNLCNETRFKGTNVVKHAKQKVLQPLTSKEIEAIRALLHRSHTFAGRENWGDVQKKCLPGRHASCLDRLWREAHPDGIFNETYTEPAIALAGRAGGTKTKPGQTKTSLAAIDMINASFHDTNVSIHKPRKARVAKSAAANEETARWNPSLFGDVGVGTVGAGVGGTVGVVAARTKTSRKGKGKGKQKPTRVSPRKHTQTQNPPAGEFTSLLFGRLEDTRDASLGFGGVGGVTHSSPPVSPPAAAALSEREMARVLFGSPSQVPEALRSPPPARGRTSNNAPHHTPTRGVRFEKEAIQDSDSDDDDDVSKGAWGLGKKKKVGRPTRVVMYAEKALADRAARVAPDREALPSSDDESVDSLGAEREQIETSDSETDDAERSELPDSETEDGEIVDPRGGFSGRGFDRNVASSVGQTRTAPPPPVAEAEALSSFLFGSLESTMPIPEDQALFRDSVGVAIETPKSPTPIPTTGDENAGQHVWTAEQDHAVLLAAQTKGVSRDTWRSLRGNDPQSALHGASVSQIEKRFKWLCDAAKKQKCAAPRGGKVRKL